MFQGWVREVSDEAAKREAAREEARQYTALVGTYLRERRAHAVTMGRFGAGRWYVEAEPACSPVFARVCKVYGPGAKATAFIAKSDLRAWLRTRDVTLETLVAALRGVGALISLGRSISLASKTRVVGVPALSIEVSLNKIGLA